MAGRTQMTSLLFAYLLLSMDPIQAFRTKRSKDKLDEKTKDAQELMKALKREMAESHVDSFSAANSTDIWFWKYWGRSCKKLKSDFEEAETAFKTTYENAAEDGEFDTIESGWIIFKLHGLVKSVEKAKERGCEWIEQHEVDLTPVQDVLKETQNAVPCIHEAREAFKSAGNDATTEDAFKAFGMLFTTECEGSSGESDGSGVVDEEQMKKDLQQEEAEEEKSLEALKVANGMHSLLQRISTDSRAFVIVLPAIVAVILGFIYAVLTCLVAVIILTAVIGMVYCLLKMILGELMDESYDDVGACTSKWIDWMKEDQEVPIIDKKYSGVKIGAGLCLANTVLWSMGAPAVVIHAGSAVYR